MRLRTSKVFQRLLTGSLAIALSVSAFAQQTGEYTNTITLFKHAKMLYLKKQYVPAIQEFEAYLATNPGNNFSYESNAYIALSRLKLEKYRADYVIRKLLRDYPEHKLNNELELELGFYYFNKKKYNRALKYLEDINENEVSKEQEEELIFKKGYSYFKEEEYEKAKKEFKKIMMGNGAYAIEASYYYGYQCYVLKDYGCALSTFEKIGTKGPKTMQLYVAQMHYEQENYEKAFIIVKDLAINGKENEIELLKGKTQYQLGNKSIALRHFKNYNNPIKDLLPDEIYQFADAYYVAGEEKQSTEFFLHIANEESETGQAANFHLGMLDVQFGNKERALNAFAEAKRKNYNSQLTEEASFNYAKLAAELQKNNIAISSIKQFLDDYPYSAYNDEAKSIMAEVFLSTKNYKQAIEVLEDIQVLNPKAKMAYQELTFHRGEELYLNREYQLANVFFNKSLKYPTNIELQALAYFWMSEIAYKVNDYDESIKLMNRFISNATNGSNTSLEYGYYSLGYSYFKKKEYIKAQNYFKQYKEKKPYSASNKATYVDNMLRLADCYFINRQYNAAIDAYDIAISKSYSNADYALYQKGMLLGLQDRHAEKIRELKKIQDDFKTSVYYDDALYQIGREYLALEKYATAENMFKLIISQLDNSKYLAQSYLKLGLIKYNQKQDNEALGYYKEVVQRFPKTRESREALSFIEIIYTNQGTPEKYFEYVKDIPGADVRKTYQDSVIYESAMVRYRDGDCDGAIKQFNSYLTRFGNDGFFTTEVNYYKAECDFFNDRKDEALKHYTYVVEQGPSDFREKSLIKLSATYYQREVYADALTYYTQLEPSATTKKTFIDAIIGQMRCHYFLRDYEQAKEKAIQILPIEDVPKEDLVEANYTLGRIQMKDSNLLNAKFHFDYVIENSRSEMTAESYYQRAFIFYSQDKLEESRQDIYTLNDDYSAYEFWVVKGFILLSDIYVKEKDYFQAKATLQSIVDNYDKEDDGLLDICRLKLEQIERLENPDAKQEDEEEDLD